MAVELSQGQEENVLALLCFSEKHASKIVEQVSVELFSNKHFRDLANAAVKHITKFGKPPGIHLKDILERKIAKSGDDGELLEQIIDNMLAMRNTMQMEFMQEQVSLFVRHRELVNRIEKASDLASKGMLDEAEELIQAPGMSHSTGNDGIYLQDTDAFLEFMNTAEEDIFSSGIRELDERGIRPVRAQTLLFIAPMKRGKSWFLTQCGKSNMILGRKVLHISLENSKQVASKRYFQSFYAYAARKAEEIELAKFVRDKDTRELLEIRFDTVTPPLISEENRSDIRKKAERLKRRARLHLKCWPSGSLSLGMLRSYLEYLEREHAYVPDIVLLDYMDLMKLYGGKDKREDLGRLGVDLRGLAQERNFALVTVTQGTRGSMGAQLVSADMVAEDISKIATADTILTYSQTPAERKRGFARIFVDRARDAEDQYIVLITQSYATGQFCLDSIYFSNDVQAITNPLVGKKRKEDDE